MSLDRLFDSIEKTRDAAHWQVAFGEPQKVEDKTIIPVARVTYGFGLGFGSGTGPSEEGGEPPTEGEGGGAGGGASTKPMGAIIVTPESVYFEETEDANTIAIAGLLTGFLIIYQIAKTLRAIFGRR